MSYIQEIVSKSMTNLFEKVMEKAKEKKDSNTNGVLHELLVGYHLNGGKHMEQHPNEDGESPEEAHDRLRDEIIRKHGQAKYEDMHKKAASAAQAIRAHLGDKPIKKVSWTSKPGDIERVTGRAASQEEDASDIYVHHHDDDHPGVKDFTGISLKTLEKKGAVAPVGNPGHGTIDRQLGTKTSKYFEIARERLKTKHPKLRKVLSIKQAKEVIKNDPKIQASEKAERETALSQIRAEHQKKFEKMSDHELWHYIKKATRAHETAHPHLRVSSSGTDGDYAHHIENPHEEHIKNWGEEPPKEEAPATGKKYTKRTTIINGKKATIYMKHPKTGAVVRQRYKAADSAGVLGNIKASIE